jgi:AraC-like DNA-binding protein
LIQHYDKESRELTNIDTKQLIDAKTGEVYDVEQIFKLIYGQKQFWKCYLMDFMAVLGIIDSRQLDIFIYICEHTNPSNNQFAGTYKKISKDLQVSERTIATILKKLQEHKFIKRIQNGLWAINPRLLMKGGERKKQILLSYYWE